MSRIVEVRRHSYTKKGEGRGRGSHLSAEGVRLAREIGERIGPFAHVVASDVPRTLETAIAMGFAVDEILPFPDAVSWDAVIAEIGWHALWELDEPFAHIAHNLPTKPETARLGEYFTTQWLAFAADIPDGQSVLIVSHGQLMEVAVVCSLPHAAHATWGPPFSHCEGARLVVEGGRFCDIELLRVHESEA